MLHRIVTLFRFVLRIVTRYGVSYRTVAIVPFFALFGQLGVDVIEAVERNDLAGVKSFIAGKGNLNQKGKNDMTPLHVASFNGRIEIVG